MRKLLSILAMALVAIAGQLICNAPTAAAFPFSSQQGDIGTLASTDCSTILLRPTCTTGVLASNPTGHWIDYHISKVPAYALSWEVRDVDTNVVVARGNIFLDVGDDGRIPGLYGRYRMKVNCTCLSTGRIYNS